MKYLNYIYTLLPKRYTERIESEANYAGYDEVPEAFVIKLMLSFYVLAAVLAAVFTCMIPLGTLIVALTLILFITVGSASPYVMFLLMAESRKKDMEVVIPDLLLLTASNIKSGLTIDRALLFAARPEFGELGKEVKKVAFELYGGETLENAFSKLTKKIKSDIFERTVNLLLEGLKSGGAIAKLLEETATDIRNTEILQKEIKASVMMYLMFIFMAAVLGAPFLFAVSTFLISGTTSMWSDPGMDMGDIKGPTSSNLPMIQMSAPSIDLDVFNYFAICAIIITTFFAGILISMIQSGNARQGLKYSPAFVIISLLIFKAVKTVMFVLFGSMLGI